MELVFGYGKFGVGNSEVEKYLLKFEFQTLKESSKVGKCLLKLENCLEVGEFPWIGKF